MHWYEPEVSELEARIKKGEITKGANLFYGSSSLRLWDSIKEDLAPHTLENIAFGGSTLEACVYFFERLVLPCEPRSIIFYAGDNDIGDGKYYSDIMSAFEELIEKRAYFLSGINFTFISIKPSPVRQKQLHLIRLVNQYVKTRINELDNMHYIDVHTKMYTADGMPDATLFTDDGLHMNAKGYALWSRVLLENADKVFV